MADGITRVSDLSVGLTFAFWGSAHERLARRKNDNTTNVNIIVAFSIYFIGLP